MFYNANGTNWYVFPGDLDVDYRGSLMIRPVFGTYQQTVSIDKYKTASAIINIYPNPAKELLTVNLNDAQQNKITVYDVVGKLVFQAETTTTQLNIDTKDFPQGVYLLQIQNESGITTKKIIKE